MRISEFIEGTNGASSTDEIFGLFVRAIEDLGYDRAIYAVVSGSPGQDLRRTPGFMLSYPEDWASYYFEHGLDKIDPVTLYSFYSPGSFVWSDLPDAMKLSKAQLACLNMGAEAGLRNGICIPLRGPLGEHTDVAIASSEPEVDPKANLDVLTLLATQFKNSYSRFVDASELAGSHIHLTPREKEVLTWCYAGKSSWDIGELLGVSESAVNFHVKNAKDKLSCSTRVACVLKATRLGLIFP